MRCDFPHGTGGFDAWFLLAGVLQFFSGLGRFLAILSPCGTSVRYDFYRHFALPHTPQFLHFIACMLQAQIKAEVLAFRLTCSSSALRIELSPVQQFLRRDQGLLEVTCAVLVTKHSSLVVLLFHCSQIRKSTIKAHALLCLMHLGALAQAHCHSARSLLCICVFFGMFYTG